MPFVFEQYLPLSWVGVREGQEGDREEEATSHDAQSGLGRPQVAAVTLVKALCVAGRHITSQLVNH